MSSFLNSVLLLVLTGLSSCSIARHGVASVPDARINWPQPEHAGRPQPGPDAHTRRDGTYSTHNYKHTNKAAQTHRLTGSDGIRVSYPQPGLAQRANYKTPMPGLRPVGGVVIDHRRATDLAAGNYKMPRTVVSGRLTAPAPESTSAKPYETLNRRVTPATLPTHVPLNPIN